MNFTDLIIISLCSITLFSCGRRGDRAVVIHESSRDNITEISSDQIISIDDNLPILHTCDLIMVGDTLILDDHLNSELKFTAYNIISDSVIGRFGKPGNGPGELANYGGIFFDDISRNLYITEAGQGKLLGFNIPEALSNSEYVPFVKYNMDFNGGNNAYTCPHYINDSTVICCVFVHNEHVKSFSTHIGRLNLITKSVSVIDSLPDTDVIRYLISVSPKHNNIFAAARTKDEIRIYDLNGNLVKTIYGPDYDDHVDNRKFYFSGSTYCRDKILAIYAGGSTQKGRDIIVMDINGNYVKTLRFDMPIHGIAYNEKTDRLYISTEDTPQFGYIKNLHELLGFNKVISTDQSSTVKSDNNLNEEYTDSSEKDSAATNLLVCDSSKVKIILSNPIADKSKDAKYSQGPLIFIDANTHGAVRTDHLKVGAYPEGNSYRYTIGILNQSNDSVCIQSISLPDSYFKAEWSTVNVMRPNMVGFLYMTSQKPLEGIDYPIVIRYCNDTFKPQILHLTLFASGADLYNKSFGSD